MLVILGKGPFRKPNDAERLLRDASQIKHARQCQCDGCREALRTAQPQYVRLCEALADNAGVAFQAQMENWSEERIAAELGLSGPYRRGRRRAP